MDNRLRLAASVTPRGGGSASPDDEHAGSSSGLPPVSTKHTVTSNENCCRKASFDDKTKGNNMSKSIDNPSVFRHLWKSVLGLGLVTLTLGVVVLVWPGKSVIVAAALFGVYLLASGIAQAIAAFTVHVPGSSPVLLFLSGALSVALGVFAFYDFNNDAAVWVLATWIGVGFLFQGVATTVLAINHKELPERGWHIFAGVLSVLAGMVVVAIPCG